QELFRLSGRNTVERRPSLSPDHALLAWGGYEDGSVQVWSTASGKMIYTLNGHTGTVLQTHFSADGHQLATASMDGTVRLWNAVDGTPLATLSGHEGGVWAIGYSGDGSRLASAGMDGRLILWDAADGSLLKTMEIGTSEWQVNSVQFTTDNRAVLVASGCIYPLNCRAGGAGDLRRIDLESGQMTTLIAEGVLDLSLSADQSAFGGMITGSMKSGQISPGEVQVLREYRSPFGKGSILGAAISPDGSLFFSGNSFGIHVWDTASGQMVALAQNLSQNGSYGSMQMTADGCILLVAGDDGVIYLWGVFSQ
ncbi:MAG: WD40 repeat domain-containing protein, partial [Chloroflexi bacterium]|nr:WD40 repeat domain-containing protein [Chloroflexota bacterium]